MKKTFLVTLILVVFLGALGIVNKAEATTLTVTSCTVPSGYACYTCSRSTTFTVSAAGQYSHNMSIIGSLNLPSYGGFTVNLKSYIRSGSTIVSTANISCWESPSSHQCNGASFAGNANLSPGTYTLSVETEDCNGSTPEYWGSLWTTGSADPVSSGTCGTAAKAYLASETSYSGTMCTSGNSSPLSPTFPSQGGSTTWSCGGNSCTATRAGSGATTPACGTNKATYNSTDTAYPNLNLFCAQGMQFPLGGPYISPWYYPPFPAVGGSSTWTCCNPYGTGGSTCLTYGCTATRTNSTPTTTPNVYNLNVSLNPSNAAGLVYNSNGIGSSDPNFVGCDFICGTSASSQLYSKCITRCNSGDIAHFEIINTQPNYTWAGWSVNGGALQPATNIYQTITGNTTLTANWTATTPPPPSATCGTNATSYTTETSYPSSTAFCSPTTSNPATNPLFPAAGGSVNWTCGTNTCTATKSAGSNSACGPAQKTYLATDTAYVGAPASLCSVGNSYPNNGTYWPTPGTYVPPFPAVGGTASWKCVGGAGSDATCNVSRASTTPIVPPTNVIAAVNSCSNASIILSWSAVAGASSYKVYKNTWVTPIVTVTSTSTVITGVSGGDVFKVSTVSGGVESALSAGVSIPPGSTPGVQPTKNDAMNGVTYSAGTLRTPAVPVVSLGFINGGSALTPGQQFYVTGTASVDSAQDQFLHIGYYDMRESASTWTLATSSDITSGYVLGGPNQISRGGQFSMGPFTAESSGGEHTIYLYVGAYPYCINSFQAENSWAAGYETYDVNAVAVGSCDTTNAKNYAYTDTSYPSGTAFCSPTTSNPSPLPSFPAAGSSVNWACGSNTCTATRDSVPQPPAATCGSNVGNYTTETSYPSSTAFCSPTTSNPSPLPSFPAAGSSVNWACGTNTCIASKASTPPSGLTCTVAMYNPSHGPVNINTNTSWRVNSTPECPTCPKLWQLRDSVNGTTTLSSNTLSPTQDVLFDTLGNKRVTVTFSSTTNSAFNGLGCSTTTLIVLSGGTTREQ